MRARRSLLDDLRGAHVADAEERQHDVLRADVVVPQLARLLRPRWATPYLRDQVSKCERSGGNQYPMLRAASGVP